MTREEMKAALIRAANPDTAAEALTEISAAVDDLYTENEAAAAATAKANETIAQLRDANMRLFLRIGGDAETEEEKEETIDEMTARLRESM